MKLYEAEGFKVRGGVLYTRMVLCVKLDAVKGFVVIFLENESFASKPNATKQWKMLFLFNQFMLLKAPLETTLFCAPCNLNF